MTLRSRRVEWTPLVGMTIESDTKSGAKAPGHRAKIIEVTESAIRVVHEASGTKTFISHNTARKQWRPVADKVEPVKGQLAATISEQRIREIVRDELRAVFSPPPRPTQP